MIDHAARTRSNVGLKSQVPFQTTNGLGVRTCSAPGCSTSNLDVESGQSIVNPGKSLNVTLKFDNITSQGAARHILEKRIRRHIDWKEALCRGGALLGKLGVAEVATERSPFLKVSDLTEAGYSVHGPNYPKYVNFYETFAALGWKEEDFTWWTAEVRNLSLCMTSKS